MTALPPFIAAAQARSDAAAGLTLSGADAAHAAARTDLPRALAALATVWDVPEVSSHDAPEWMDAEKAYGWACGYDAALAVVRARIAATLTQELT